MEFFVVVVVVFVCFFLLLCFSSIFILSFYTLFGYGESDLGVTNL